MKTSYFIKVGISLTFNILRNSISRTTISSPNKTQKLADCSLVLCTMDLDETKTALAHPFSQVQQIRNFFILIDWYD